jgi:NAD(P)H-dependent flavin oxidoreductase YrpB (nitropropane dioxygenase family)
MGALLERLRVELPIVQAGMGGGLARHELAAAVSDAGGLGQISVLGQAAIERELAAARQLTGKPIAVNILLPFAHDADFRAAEAADAVVTFWGPARRRTRGVWLHQIGSVDEARAAHGAGADGVIVQGVEAGGHVRGRTPALDLLEQVRAALAHDYPLLLAGGIAEPGDVRAALDAGAEAAVAGTRFLISDESRAHPQYKARLLDARETILTELFGLTWPAAPHRVVPNAATRRWIGDGDPRGARVVRALNRVSGPLASVMSERTIKRASATQRAWLPLLSPAAATDELPASLVDAGPLYAGETVARISSLRPAGELVRELAV